MSLTIYQSIPTRSLKTSVLFKSHCERGIYRRAGTPAGDVKIVRTAAAIHGRKIFETEFRFVSYDRPMSLGSFLNFYRRTICSIPGHVHRCWSISLRCGFSLSAHRSPPLSAPSAPLEFYCPLSRNRQDIWRCILIHPNGVNKPGSLPSWEMFCPAPVCHRVRAAAQHDDHIQRTFYLQPDGR